MGNYNFKLDKIILKNKSEIKPNLVNIIIGPNNAGKSKFLRELAGFFCSNNEENYIIDNIEFELPKNYNEFEESYKLTNKIILDFNGSERLRTYFNGGGYFNYPYIYNRNDFDNEIILSKNLKQFLKQYGCLFLNYLGTENRLTMIKTQNYNIDFSHKIEFLTELLNNAIDDEENILEQLYESVKRVFKKDILLDKETIPGNLFFRIGDDFSYYRNAKKNNQTVVKELKKASILDNEGDGLKSFVSTYLSLKYDEKNIIAIDEPESFLHPPLARQLGEIIGENANPQKQIFITTHSSEILKGVLSKCKDVNVIRITREENANEITILDNETLEKIISTPRLRVSKILDGLFCERVAITEAESDEIFYQEFLEKIKPQSGIFFTHVNNKQNVYIASQMYRKLNVDNIMIFDFDILRKDKEFSTVLNTVKLEPQYITKYCAIRKRIENYIITNSEFKDICYHQKGIRILEGELKKEVEDMLNHLMEFGVFILRNGELETSLEDAGIEYSDNKNEWITQALEYIEQANIEDIKQISISTFVEKLI